MTGISTKIIKAGNHAVTVGLHILTAQNNWQSGINVWHCWAWWRIGRVDAFRPKGHGFESRYNQWRNHTRAITGSARVGFISARAVARPENKLGVLCLSITNQDVFRFKTAV